MMMLYTIYAKNNLQRSPRRPQHQSLLNHECRNILRNALRNLKSAPTSPIPMNDIPLPIKLLSLNAYTTFSGRPPPNNILDDVELPAALGSEREPLGRVGEQSFPRLWRGMRIPFMRLLGAADDRSPVQWAWNAKGPRAVRVLAGDCCRDGVPDEAGLT